VLGMNLRLAAGLAIGAMTFFSFPSNATPLSEIGLLARCYAHLTGKPLPLNHPLRQKVANHLTSALIACEQILDLADLDANGSLAHPSDPEARAVLRNFNDFHRSWFPSSLVESIQEYSLEMSRGTQDIYDSTEPALAITRAMFAQDGRYSDVVTAANGWHAIRQEDPAIRNRVGWKVTFPGRRVYANETNLDLNLFHFFPLEGGYDGDTAVTKSIFATLPKIEVGELIGIRAKTEAVMVPHFTLHPLGDGLAGNKVPALNFNFDLNASLGGGVLGTPIYLMMNYGQGRGVMSNGTTKLPRRWSATNMTTFLCASLPALREVDVRQYLVGNSSAPFRNSSSCLRCHANLDQMGYTARHVITGGTDFSEFAKGDRTHAKMAMVLASFRSDKPGVSGWPSEPVPDFHRMPPTGKLYFRSFANGELISQAVNNISALGQAMATTDDFYQCAAQRYFAFFTGIHVSLYDRQDPSNAALNKALNIQDIQDRAFVESLGAELRQTQSLRSMIKRILGSEYYRSSAYRPAQ